MKWKTKIQKSMVILCAGAWSVSLGNAGAMAECQDQTEECNPVKYDKVREDMVPTGAVVTIIRESTAENGVLWGYTYYDHCYGWITLTPVIRVE